jgi:uncharacterized protein (TIGR00297 family)
MTFSLVHTGSVFPLLTGPHAHSRFWVAAIVTVGFAVIAHLLRGVTLSGAMAGAAICFALYAGVGPAAFALLVIVFVFTWLATRLGYRYKERLGTAEPREGRKASQILANLSVAGVCGVLYAATGHRPALLAAIVAALAEATADTVSSEIGQTVSSRARLITSGKQVLAGTNGGITLAGTLCGLTAAFAVCLVSATLGLASPAMAEWCAAAAAIGMFADSFMGALFESRGLLNNDAVNFLSTGIAAMIAMLLG